MAAEGPQSRCGNGKGSRMKYSAIGAAVLFVSALSGAHAQDGTTITLSGSSAPLNAVKAKIFDANMAAQTLGKGAKFCTDMDGSTVFYFAARDRVLNLAEYHRSLENLAREGIFNPETKKPWSEQEASARWNAAQQEAVKDKSACDLIATLPALQKQLQDMQNAQTSDK
jgi:hypothetical protein